jgi:serine/threonine protein kinase
VPIAVDAQADALIGSVFADRYRIERMLGEGGMGTVYRAHHTGLDCAVAVKVLRPGLTADPVISRRFDREAVALSKLDHPNCLRVLDAGTAPTGAKYIVMPLLEGRELRALLGTPLPTTRALDLAIQILRGLEHAHRRGMIHRDLKPENVLVVVDDYGHDVAKLVDFGIVKMLLDDGGAEPLTRVGLVFGTPRYMSPEQVTGGRITESTDLYSVGIILFEMLTGAAPFDADDAGMLMRMQILGDVPALPETVPPAVATIVRRLLEKSPGDRFASAGDVREALESAAIDSSRMSTQVAPPFAPAPSTSGQAPIVMTMPAQRRASTQGLGSQAAIIVVIVLALAAITTLAVLWPETPVEPSTGAAVVPPQPPAPASVLADPVGDIAPASPSSSKKKRREREKGRGNDKKADRDKKGR